MRRPWRSMPMLVVLVLGLSVAGSVHSQVPAGGDADALWVATLGGLVKVSPVDGTTLLRVARHAVQLVAVDEASRRVWTFDGQTLTAFDGNGQRLIAVPVPPAPLSSALQRALAVDSRTGAVWLALAQSLHRFDAE